MTLKKSDVNQAKYSSLRLQVMDDLTVQIYTNPKFDFLMDTETVAKGYGVSVNAIHSHRSRYADEFKEDIHYATAGTLAICNTLKNVQSHAVYWTKAGVVRLGFFIKSERAKMFRDWAENVILKTITPQLPANLPKPKKRRHNRLTPTRMVGILADVAKIEDRDLRLSLIEKLGV